MADRAADMIAEFGGSWKFIGVSIGLIVFWIIFNSYILVGFRSDAVSDAESGVGGHRRHAGADHHDVAESAGREGSTARGSGLPGEFEKRTVAGGSVAPSWMCWKVSDCRN